MPLYVLKSIAHTGQTRFVANYRNGRSRVVAFDTVHVARRAVDVVKRDPTYAHERVDACETNQARLTADVGGAEIAIDFCDLTGDEVCIIRSILLKKRHVTYQDTERMRVALERDAAIDLQVEDELA